MKRLFSLLFLLLNTHFITGQESLSKKPDTSSCVIIHFKQDGGSLKVNILQDNVRIITKYGELTVPFSEIWQIDFGFHCPPELQKEVQRSVYLLTSDIFKERENASRHLEQIGHFAYPCVRRAAESKDFEQASRAKVVAKWIEGKSPPELLALKDFDTITTKEYPINGRIVGSEFKAQCPTIGDFTFSLKFSDLSTLVGNAENQDKNFSLDASKYGTSPEEQWFNTHVRARKNSKLLVTASGSVDIWPQGPGQYTATPKGFNTTGGKSSFMAGALIGRIGEKGKAFIIGERYDGVSEEEGNLFVLIVSSPWNNFSSGSFNVSIKTNPPR